MSTNWLAGCAGVGMDSGQGEEHPSVAVLTGQGSVGRGEAVEACWHAGLGLCRPGEEGLPQSRPLSAPWQGEADHKGQGGGGEGGALRLLLAQGKKATSADSVGFKFLYVCNQNRTLGHLCTSYILWDWWCGVGVGVCVGGGGPLRLLLRERI